MSNKLDYLKIVLASVFYFIVIYFFAGVVNTNVYYIATYWFLFIRCILLLIPYIIKLTYYIII